MKLTLILLVLFAIGCGQNNRTTSRKTSRNYECSRQSYEVNCVSHLPTTSKIAPMYFYDQFCYQDYQLCLSGGR